MTNIEIALKNQFLDVEEVVKEATSLLGLTISMLGTLSSYPGSKHWHFKSGKKSGTLEVTWYPRENRLWISYHENRIGDGWVKDQALDLGEMLERRL